MKDKEKRVPDLVCQESDEVVREGRGKTHPVPHHCRPQKGKEVGGPGGGEGDDPLLRGTNQGCTAGMRHRIARLRENSSRRKKRKRIVKEEREGAYAFS